ncbi:MAG TPA: hypothetical protein VNQ53_08420 [Nocardioides sp.]|nr:hypothetical protein [Nocardioides sp.]
MSGTGNAEFEGDYGYTTPFTFTCEVEGSSFTVVDTGPEMGA